MSEAISLYQGNFYQEDIYYLPAAQPDYSNYVLSVPANDYNAITTEVAVGEEVNVKAATAQWVIGTILTVLGDISSILLGIILSDISSVKNEIKDARIELFKQVNDLNKSIASVDTKASVTNQRLDDIAKTLKPPR